MKLVYISNSKLPTQLAHGLQVMQMCGAFAENGSEVELLVPRRVGGIGGDPFGYYGVESNFKITKIPCLDLIFLGGNKLTFIFELLTFLLVCRLKLFAASYDMVYSREYFSALFFGNVCLEIHSLPKNVGKFYIYLLKRARALIVLTPFIKERLVSLGLEASRISVAPDAVNLEKFDINLSKDEARKKLGLPLDKKLIGYVGMLRTLGMEKGVDLALRALTNLGAKLPNEGTCLVLVGGYKEDIEFYKSMADNLGVSGRVIFTSMVRHNLVPLYLKAFDILVAPFPETEHYKFFMSPLKIFEYMASGRPIISTTLPSLKEVLNDKNSVLVKPGDSLELAQAIAKLLSDQFLADTIASRALEDVRKYTWQKRAGSILDFVCSPTRVSDALAENVQSFSSDISVESYSKIYLRSGEDYVIKKYMPAGARVLDVGCGAGRTTYFIKKNGAEVIGVDIASPLVERAKKLFPEIEFRVMDARSLDFADETFNVVFFSFNGIDNLTPLDERRRAIMEMKRVLKPGGYLIYSSHNSLALPRTWNSIKIIYKNLMRLRIGPHWRREEYQFGRLTEYYNNIWDEVGSLASLGFKNVHAIGNSKTLLHAPKILLAFLDKFPIYIAQK